MLHATHGARGDIDGEPRTSQPSELSTEDGDKSEDDDEDSDKFDTEESAAAAAAAADDDDVVVQNLNSFFVRTSQV